ncbi:hypothetical protein Bca52824_026298 [Brassica carinata]|uniref:Uncharacterized protein n=1 Tax=Brassica carinata TaxID=52824 RepID=A0A8X7SJH0_BRACI|nr:hypothetical protein Bca52824_026298 [Brassica carinata]
MRIYLPGKTLLWSLPPGFFPRLRRRDRRHRPSSPWMPAVSVSDLMEPHRCRNFLFGTWDLLKALPLFYSPASSSTLLLFVVAFNLSPSAAPFLLTSLSMSHRYPREDTLQPLELYTSPHTTAPSVFNSNRLGPCERSPIRTLSEDRIHVSLRLGPLLLESEEDSADTAALQLKEARASKAIGKRIATSSQSQKRTGRSPNQDAPPKRRRTTTKTKPSPCRKLMLDAITGGGGETKYWVHMQTSTSSILTNLVLKLTLMRSTRFAVEECKV